MNQDSLPGFEEVERRPTKSYVCGRCNAEGGTVWWEDCREVFVCCHCGTIDKKRTKEWQDAGKTK